MGCFYNVCVGAIAGTAGTEILKLLIGGEMGTLIVELGIDSFLGLRRESHFLFQCDMPRFCFEFRSLSFSLKIVISSLSCMFLSDNSLLARDSSFMM